MVNNYDGTNSLTYDADGNMTGDGVNSYTWDRANRLLSLGGVSYAYNGDGDRVAQTSGVNVTQYLLDLQPGLALVLGDSDGNRYVHAPRGLHAVDDGAAWSYSLADGLGSVRGYVDTNNAVLSDVDYSPYGVPDTAWTGWASTGEQRDSNALQYHRARYYAPGLGIFPSLDPFEGIMERPMSLNGYAYVHGNPINLTDPSGLCPLLNEPGLVNQADARQCQSLVNALGNRNIRVVWDNKSLASLVCLPDTMQVAANQDLLIRQRWTTREVRATFNAFEVFEGAYQKLGMASVYRWPLSDGISIEKRRYVGTSAADLTALGKHEYLSRRITMSALNWGEAEKTAYELNAQIRAWLVLHEFSHIFVKDRTPPGIGAEYYTTDLVNGLPALLLARFGRVVPTAYATASEQERAIEVVTATLWNNGYIAVSGFESGAGGRTAALGERATDSYEGGTFILTNVHDINVRGQTLEQWVIENVILRNP